MSPAAPSTADLAGLRQWLDPTAQFRGEQNPEWHGGPLGWLGHPDVPFPVRLRDGKELPIVPTKTLVQSLVTVSVQHNHTFDLSDPAESDYYNWVMRRVRARWFREDLREPHWDDAANGQRIYLEWTQFYAELHDASPDAASTDGSGPADVEVIRD